MHLQVNPVSPEGLWTPYVSEEQMGTGLVSMVTLESLRGSLQPGGKGRMSRGEGVGTAGTRPWRWGQYSLLSQDSELLFWNWEGLGERVRWGGRLGHERWLAEEQMHFRKKGVAMGALKFPSHTGMPS